VSSTFLDAHDICQLTGRKTKSKQIEALRKMGIPFFINAAGHPIVTLTAIEGGKKQSEPLQKQEWVPHVLRKK